MASPFVSGIRRPVTASQIFLDRVTYQRISRVRRDPPPSRVRPLLESSGRSFLVSFSGFLMKNARHVRRPVQQGLVGDVFDLLCLLASRSVFVGAVLAALCFLASARPEWFLPEVWHPLGSLFSTFFLVFGFALAVTAAVGLARRGG
jgi:hypothetical protein